MNKILILIAVFLLFGCQSTIQEINNKYSNTNDRTVQKEPSSVNKLHKLYVNVVPSAAQIYITNIKPKFAQGIELKNGEYKIKVKKQGFKTVLQTVNFSSLDKDKTLTIAMKKDESLFVSSKNIRTMTRLRNPSTVQSKIKKTIIFSKISLLA